MIWLSPLRNSSDSSYVIVHRRAIDNRASTRSGPLVVRKTRHPSSPSLRRRFFAAPCCEDDKTNPWLPVRIRPTSRENPTPTPFRSSARMSRSTKRSRSDDDGGDSQQFRGGTGSTSADVSSRRTVKARLRSSTETEYLEEMAKLNYQASVFASHKLIKGVPEDSHYAAFAQTYM